MSALKRDAFFDRLPDEVEIKNAEHEKDRRFPNQ